MYKSRLLSFVAVIYYTWRFRNDVVFNRATINCEFVARNIMEDCNFRCIHRLNIGSRRGLALARRLGL